MSLASFTNPLSLIQVELRRLEGAKFGITRFEPSLEAKYQRQIVSQKMRLNVRIACIGLAVFDLFSVNDWFLDRHHFYSAFVARWCVVTPILLLLLAIAGSNRIPWIRDASLAAGIFVIDVASLYLAFGGRRSFILRSEPAIFMSLILATVVFRIAPWQTLWLLVATSVVNIGSMIYWFHFAVMDWALYALSFIICCFLLFFALCLMLRLVRRLFLLQLQSEGHMELMALHNRELREISERDVLTGLANRYLYERKLQMLFEEARISKAPLSVVMVDVDHFKIINDTYGHVYGDRVLQRVGALIQESLREEGDFAARYGGEEFIVLLPDVDRDVAITVAERIRNLVEIAGSPAMARSPQQQVTFATVSCGVASGIPSAGQDAPSFVEAADAAMYQAKARGRNQVCCTEITIA